MLMMVMFLLAAAVGAVIAASVAVHGAEAPRALMPSAMTGAAVALAVAALVSLWVWYGGASAVLAFAGAREIRKSDDPQLFNVVEELAIAAGLPMPRLFIIEETAMNAFATGRDPRHAAVAITRGLRDALTREELQGVMAHEMAHVRHLDTRYALLMATMVGLIAFVTDAFFRLTWHALRAGVRGGRRTRAGGPAVLILLLVALVLAVVAPLAATLVQLAYSRQREYLADAGAVELTRNPMGLASALLRLAADTDPLVDRANRATAHMYIVNPLRRSRQAHHDLDSIFSSHPPIRERVARLLALTR